MRSAFGCGPDAARHLEVARTFAEAGYDHLALINAVMHVIRADEEFEQTQFERELQRSRMNR